MSCRWHPLHLDPLILEYEGPGVVPVGPAFRITSSDEKVAVVSIQGYDAVPVEGDGQSGELFEGGAVSCHLAGGMAAIIIAATYQPAMLGMKSTSTVPPLFPHSAKESSAA